MNKYIFILFTLLVLSQSVWSNPSSILNTENVPPEFEADYDVYKGSMRVGKMSVVLKKIGDELVYESKAKPTGIAAFFLGDQNVSDRAVLKLNNGNYQSKEFKHVMNNSGEDRDEHYLFDWENKKVTVDYKEKDGVLNLPDNTYDVFSAQLLLMRKPDKMNAEHTYSILTKGKLREHTYQLEKQEIVQTKLGNINANKYVRTEDNKKKTTYMGWYAEKLNHIPVKLDKYENGKLDISIQLTSIKWLNENYSN
jgi:hypothetical protein